MFVNRSRSAPWSSRSSVSWPPWLPFGARTASAPAPPRSPCRSTVQRSPAAVCSTSRPPRRPPPSGGYQVRPSRVASKPKSSARSAFSRVVLPASLAPTRTVSPPSSGHRSSWKRPNPSISMRSMRISGPPPRPAGGRCRAPRPRRAARRRARRRTAARRAAGVVRAATRRRGAPPPRARAARPALVLLGIGGAGAASSARDGAQEIAHEVRRITSGGEVHVRARRVADRLDPRERREQLRSSFRSCRRSSR